MSELSYKELQEQGVFDVPYRAFKYMQSQQAKIDELQDRIDKADSLIMSFGNSIDIPLRNSLIDAIRGLEDL